MEPKSHSRYLIEEQEQNMRQEDIRLEKTDAFADVTVIGVPYWQ
jgi:hypothetical protein